MLTVYYYIQFLKKYSVRNVFKKAKCWLSTIIYNLEEKKSCKKCI